MCVSVWDCQTRVVGVDAPCVCNIGGSSRCATMWEIWLVEIIRTTYEDFSFEHLYDDYVNGHIWKTFLCVSGDQLVFHCLWRLRHARLWLIQREAHLLTKLPLYRKMTLPDYHIYPWITTGWLFVFSSVFYCVFARLYYFFRQFLVLLCLVSTCRDHVSNFGVVGGYCVLYVRRAFHI